MFQVKPQQIDDEDPFERQRRIEWWDQTILRQARVMVVGAGALGNETLKNLALLGVGQLFILDFDTISASNLSRTVLFRKNHIGQPKAAVAAAATRELALESTACISYFHGDMVWDLGLGAYRRMDIVLGCVDNDEARLAINRACRSVGVPWINSGILGFSGNVMIFGREGACYECNVTPDQVEDSRSRYDSCENVRKRFLKEERMPTVQITSALVSALQVQEAIKLLHNQFPALGKRIAINGLTNNYAVINLQPYENCLAHGTYETIIELPLQAQTNTLGELAALVVAQLGPQAVIDLGRRFIQEIRCRQCSEWVKLMRPAHRVYDDELICQGCRQNWQHPQTAVDRATHRLETFTPKNFDVANSEYLRSLSQISVPDIPPDWQKLSLWDLGMPPLHIFTAHNPQGDQITLELTGDLTTVFADLNVG